MILSPGSSLAFSSPLLLVLGAAAGYALAALPADNRPHLGSAALAVGWVLHFVLLLFDISGIGQGGTGARLGFAPVLSATVWLVIGVHTLESRLVPLPSVRKGLAIAGVLAVLLAAAYPGDVRQFSSPMGPLHFVLGVASYGLFGAAVLHGVLLDAAERRLKQHKGMMGLQGMPLLQLERITFRFVEAGFAVLTATLVLGLLVPHGWRLEHKTVFSILGWAVFAALLLGRRLRGWRGRRATRWLYVGAVLLLLAYVGSRFVLEVVLGRTPPG